MKLILILTIIIIIITITLSLIKLFGLFKGPSGPSGPILKKYNDISYDKDGKPNGGVLVTMLSTNLFCPKYKISSNQKCSDIDDCTNIFDIGDINNLLNQIKKSGAGTNCYSFDTTYLRKDLPNYLFGPVANRDPTKRQDYVIGLILDVDKLWNYIACLYPIDSGSIARYNNTEPTNSIWWKISNSKDKWNDYLNNKYSKNLGLCGCGNLNNIPSSRGLNSPANTFIINKDSLAEKHVNYIKSLKSANLYNDNINNPSYWAFSDNNKPYSKYQWKYFVESFKHIYSIANNFNFVNNQCTTQAGDGYRENEVDIIIPNNTKNQMCDVIDDFKKVFIDSIMGVFTNANSNCSSKIDKGLNCFSCKGNCCCNEEFHQKIVKKLVDKFNKAHNKKIEGYLIDTLSVSNFNYNSNEFSKLNLKKIL